MVPEGWQKEKVAERREAIVQAVEAHWANHGYGPTRPELAEATGLSEATVSTHVRGLIDDGVLVEPGGSRTLRIGF